MRCDYCHGELSPADAHCPACGEPAGAALAAAAHGGEDDARLAAQAEGPAAAGEGFETGVSADAPAGADDSGARADAADSVLDSQIRRVGWAPKRDKVDAWAIRKELNHYEVLELEESASDEELSKRVDTLGKRLDRWAGDPQDYDLQRLGSEGKRRFYELRHELSDRAAYDAFVREEQHKAARRRVREAALQCVAADRTLQWNEWKFTLLPKAEEEGVGREELEEILVELRGMGVLTGLDLAGREVRTILELKDLCDGWAKLLVEPLWDGRLENWLEIAALRRDLAQEAREVRGRYATEDERLLGAQRILWKMNERRLVLAGADGVPGGKVAGVGEWVAGVYERGLEDPSLRALEGGLLEGWLDVALNQPHLCRVAANERWNGRAGLWKLIWETGERGDPEAGYRVTKSLVEESPKFWEAHYQHALNCAVTSRREEMRAHLQTAVKGDAGYATRALNEERLQPFKRDVLPLVKGAVPVAASFKFGKKGEAFSVPDLVTLCDEHPADAHDYLYNGYLEEWLGKKQGEGELAKQARSIIGANKDKARGLELFVRALCEDIGSEPYPKLMTEPARGEFGTLPVGAKGSVRLQLKNLGRGHAWGKVTVEPELPGLKHAKDFKTAGDSIELELFTLKVQPGDYAGRVVISAEGVPGAVEVPLHYQVVPLEVKVEPPAVELGKVMHGTKPTVNVRVSCKPAGGKIVATRQKLEPYVKGVHVAGHVEGEDNQLVFTVDTSQLKTGTAYKTEYIIDTNVGQLRIPVSFKTSLFWKYILFWQTLAFGVGTGAVMFTARYLLQQVGGLDGWFLSYDSNLDIILATGGFGAVVLGAAALVFRRSKAVRALYENRLVRKLREESIIAKLDGGDSINTLNAGGAFSTYDVEPSTPKRQRRRS